MTKTRIAGLVLLGLVTATLAVSHIIFLQKADEREMATLGGWFSGHGQLIHQLTGFYTGHYWSYKGMARYYPRHLAFNRDGSILLSASNRDEILLWNFERHSLIRRFNGSRRFKHIRYINFAHDEKNLLIQTPAGLAEVEIKSNELQGYLIKNKPRQFLTARKLPEQLLVGYRWPRSGEVDLFEAYSKKKIGSYKLPVEEVYSAAIDKEGRFLAIAGGENIERTRNNNTRLYIYKIETGELLKKTRFFGWAEKTFFTPDAMGLFCHIVPGKIYAFDLSGGTIRRQKQILKGNLMAFSRKLAALAENGPWVYSRPTTQILPLTRGPEALSLKGHGTTIKSMAFHPTLPVLATGSKDQTIKLWNLSP